MSNQNKPPSEAPIVRAMVWIDGQNLFHRAKSLFGHGAPDYDIRKLPQALCDRMGWKLDCVHFYSGIPPEQESPRWHRFWKDKLKQTADQGGVPVHTFTPELRYRNEWSQRHDGQWQIYRAATEKGVDVRLALDMVAAAYEKSCDAMIIMSEDSDLQQAVDRCKEIAKRQGREIKIANAFPHNPAFPHRKAMSSTTALRFDHSFYEKNLQQVQMHHNGGTAKNPKDHSAIERANQAMHAKITQGDQLQTQPMAARFRPSLYTK